MERTYSHRQGLEPHDAWKEKIHKHHQNHSFDAQARIKANVLAGSSITRNGSESEFLSKLIPKKGN